MTVIMKSFLPYRHDFTLFMFFLCSQNHSIEFKTFWQVKRDWRTEGMIPLLCSKNMYLQFVFIQNSLCLYEMFIVCVYTK